MLLNTFRFGEIEIDDAKVITFAEGLPGFEELKTFTLLTTEDTRPLLWMQAIENGDIALPVIDPFEVLGDYGFELSEADMHSLEVDSLEKLLVLNVAVIPRDLSGMTANMAAPVIVNVAINKGKQILLEGKEYNVRRPIFTDVMKFLQRGEADAGTEQKSE